jgi:hypothetical protein
MMKSKDLWKKRKFNSPKWLKRTNARLTKRSKLSSVCVRKWKIKKRKMLRRMELQWNKKSLRVTKCSKNKKINPNIMMLLLIIKLLLCLKKLSHRTTSYFTISLSLKYAVLIYRMKN